MQCKAPSGASCLITGVAGFVGSHLAQALLRLGCPVIGVDNFFSGLPANLAAFADHPGFTFHEANVTDAQLLPRLRRAHPRLEIVFHLAAIVSVPHSMEHEAQTLQVNRDASLRLLSQAEALGLRRFVLAGSAAEYGNETRLPIREDYATAATHQLSPYGRSKYEASLAVSCSPIGISLRFFNIYGERQLPDSPYSGVISKFIALALAKTPLPIFGSGEQSRDFLHVTDAVQAYLAAVGLTQNGRVPAPGVYNVGTGIGTTILELAECIQRAVGNRPAVRLEPPRPGDIVHSRADATAFARATDWWPTRDLPTGLRRTIDWLAGEGGKTS